MLTQQRRDMYPGDSSSKRMQLLGDQTGTFPPMANQYQNDYYVVVDASYDRDSDLRNRASEDSLA